MANRTNIVGAKSDKMWRHAIMRAVNRVANDGKTKHLDILALRLIKAGAEGDVSALREIGDRLDGKPTTTVEMGDETIKAIKGIKVTYGS